MLRGSAQRHRAALGGSSLAHAAVLALLIWLGAPRAAHDAGPATEPIEMVFEPAPVPAAEPALTPFAPEALPPEALPPELTAPEASPPAVTDEPPPAPEAVSPPVAAPSSAPAPEPEFPSAPPIPQAAAPPQPPVSAAPLPPVHAPAPAKPASRPRPPPGRAAPERAAPERAASGPAAAAAPPVAAAPTSAAAASVNPAWRQAVEAWVLQHKRYPEAARRRGEAGTVGVSFAVSRGGQVGEAVVTASSGSAILDDAVLALLNGRQVPPFPPDMSQAQVRMSVRMVYTLEQ